jgi:hypothetical protein
MPDIKYLLYVANVCFSMSVKVLMSHGTGKQEGYIVFYTMKITLPAKNCLSFICPRRRPRNATGLFFLILMVLFMIAQGHCTRVIYDGYDGYDGYDLQVRTIAKCS